MNAGVLFGVAVIVLLCVVRSRFIKLMSPKNYDSQKKETGAVYGEYSRRLRKLATKGKFEHFRL